MLLISMLLGCEKRSDDERGACANNFKQIQHFLVLHKYDLDATLRDVDQVHLSCPTYGHKYIIDREAGLIIDPQVHSDGSIKILNLKNGVISRVFMRKKNRSTIHITKPR